MKALFTALKFLTIIPVRVNEKISEDDIAKSAVFFPVVGAVQGSVLIICAVAFSSVFTSEINAVILIVIGTLLNGAFHLDGLADTFDALAVKSTGNPAVDRERRLDAMKDSRAGAIGIVAVSLALLFKFSLLSGILSDQGFCAALVIIFLASVFSRWAMVPAMYHGVSARRTGLGWIFIEGARFRFLAASYALVILLFAAATASLKGSFYGLNDLILFIILPAGHALAAGFSAFGRKIFGGLTGDTLGALSELSEIFFLLGAYIWLRHFI